MSVFTHILNFKLLQGNDRRHALDRLRAAGSE
jgi:hypothetical protein